MPENAVEDTGRDREPNAGTNENRPFWTHLGHPAVILVLTTLGGVIGTIASTTASGVANALSDRTKFQGTLILDAIRTPEGGEQRDRQVAANLILLVDAGLINIEQGAQERLRKKADGTVPGLSLTTAVPAGEQSLSMLVAQLFYGNDESAKAATEELHMRTLRTDQLIDLAQELKRNVGNKPRALLAITVLAEYGNNPHRTKSELKQYVDTVMSIATTDTVVEEKLGAVKAIWKGVKLQ